MNATTTEYKGTLRGFHHLRSQNAVELSFSPADAEQLNPIQVPRAGFDEDTAIQALGRQVTVKQDGNDRPVSAIVEVRPGETRRIYSSSLEP